MNCIPKTRAVCDQISLHKKTRTQQNKLPRIRRWARQPHKNSFVRLYSRSRRTHDFNPLSNRKFLRDRKNTPVLTILTATN
ncbi:hypothetical protein V1264_017550 [Littorina saxatilis]|uniref:Uncharacterized protein n=1 Tax=Littorina saxatilis TaxID=31220 RepID=A0AAN9BJG0_9CAEN